MDSRGEVFGPYVVYEQIGIGGMASVHRAETTGLAGFRRPVALKRMLPHVAADEELVQSFVREARLASYLRHANVAQTYDLGKVGDIYFIAMELVPGRNLREILKYCLKAGVQIPIPIALNILTQVCDALDYAHNLTDESGRPLGIIHRDVSPSNVIVSQSGVVKLIDFGIAKMSAEGMQTLSGTIKGKFGYMAPEYLGGTIDARADLFALGIIGHELLTNRPLFGGRDDMDTLYRVKSMPIKPPSHFNMTVPPEIDSIVMTALERDPESRWQRAAAMRVALATETRRLGMTVLDQHVVDWCESVFLDGDVDTPAPTRVLRTTPPANNADTSPSIVIERIDHDVDDDLADDDLSSTRLRASSAMPVPVPRASQQIALPQPAPFQPPPPRPSVASVASPGMVEELRGSVAQLPLPPPPSSGDRPSLLPLSGSRTAPIAAQNPAQHTIAIDQADVVGEVAVAGKRLSNWIIALLLLVTAAATGAVVYFGLPYLQ
ncbi:MAG TPA: serine/threonine-protein kinase [Kofleriaceae bacterium]